MNPERDLYISAYCFAHPRLGSHLIRQEDIDNMGQPGLIECTFSECRSSVPVQGRWFTERAAHSDILQAVGVAQT
jgi:hypothetical protein